MVMGHDNIMTYTIFTRCRVSVIKMLKQPKSLFSKIDHLRKHFQTGSFLESLEDGVEFPTLHLEYMDKEPECDDLTVEDSFFKTKIAYFCEISL